MNKKIFFTIILLFLVTICLTVCAYAINGNVIKNLIKSFDEMNIDINTNMLENKSSTKNIIINDKVLTAQYKGTKMESDIYTTEDGSEYLYKGNKLVGFIKELDIEKIKNEHDKIDEKTAQKIAYTFAKENVDNFNKYGTHSTTYVESYCEYSIVYMYCINGIPTQDFITINVNDFGEVASFSALNQGEFEKYVDLKLNLDNINNELLNQVNTESEKVPQDISIQEQFLRILDNQLYLQSLIKIVYDGNTVDFKTLMYEINEL